MRVKRTIKGTCCYHYRINGEIVFCMGIKPVTIIVDNRNLCYHVTGICNTNSKRLMKRVKSKLDRIFAN